MRPGFRSLLIPLAALALVGAAGAAPVKFTNNVCKFVPAKNVTAIPGMSSACTEQKALPAPGATDYVGNWKGLEPTEGLQITIERYTDTGMLQLATHNLGQGLLSTPKKVSGIGDAAYEAKGAGGVEVKTTTGNYIAIIVLIEHQEAAEVAVGDRAARPGGHLGPLTPARDAPRRLEQPPR